jgi:phage-related protein
MEITVDGFDLAELGVRVRDVRGHRAHPQRRVPTSVIPGRPPVRLGSAPVEPRRITLEMWQRAATVPSLIAVADELAARLSREEITLVLGDRPDRAIRATAEDVDVPPIAPWMVQPAHQVRVTLLCPDPYWYDVAEDVVALSAAGVEVPLGSGPVWPRITVQGPAADPVLVARDHAGAEVARMDFTGLAVAAGASIEIDCLAKTIRSGAGEDLEHALVLGGARGAFLSLRAEDAGGPFGPWPTVALSDGSGALSYRRSWL